MKTPVIAVFGSSEPRPGQPEYEIAYELGRGIARAGWILCNGGYGGTMEAAAKGAVEAGGHTIGVTCRVFGRGGPNAYVRQDVPTFDLLSRLNTLVRLGDAYVVLPGGTGTLLELALIWELINKRLLRGKPRPIVLVGEYWRPVIEAILRAQPDALRPQFAANAQVALTLLTEHFDAARPLFAEAVEDESDDPPSPRLDRNGA